MYQRRTGSYDEIPEGMKRYINNYGCHFNKKLCDEAVKRMYTMVNGKKQVKAPYTKEKVEQLMTTYGITLERNKLYDHVYVANMCSNDYLGKSVIDEKHLVMFVKDMIDDPDAEEGFIFNRWYADTIFMNDPVDWEEMYD
jgi:hypothetical protein